MYQEFYNFQFLPFECTPDPRFFFASEQHREALAAIEYTIRMRKGIVMVTGPVGSGKTTVGRTMLQRCHDQATLVQVVHGHGSGNELIKHVLRALKVQPAGDDHAQLLEQLGAQLTEHARRQKPVVLFVDEAQTLCDDALEELRLLSNFDTNTQRLLQLVLVGQPELRERVRSERMAPLRQRIVMAKQLAPLSLPETARYVVHRLKAASRDRENLGVMFATDAFAALYDQARGIPRLINVICDNCLLMGFVAETRRITAGMVHRVVQDMVPDLEFDNVKNVEAPRLALAVGA